MEMTKSCICLPSGTFGPCACHIVMLQLVRARVVRGDPCHISAKSTTLQRFPVYGNKQVSLVCNSHDLLKSQVVTIHIQDRAELILSLDAAAPSSCWKQLGEAHEDVLYEFGIHKSFLCAASSCYEPSVPFVGVGNCFGNIWPEDPTKGLYPCTLSLCFVDSVARGSAILMGSVHSMECLDDVPHLMVCVRACVCVFLARHLSVTFLVTRWLRLLERVQAAMP